MKIDLNDTQIQELLLVGRLEVVVTITTPKAITGDVRLVTLKEFIEEFLPRKDSYIELASKCGMNRSVFHAMYNKGSSIPRLSNMIKIENSLGVRISDD